MKRLRDVLSTAIGLSLVVLLLGVQLTDGAGVHRCPAHDRAAAHLAVQAAMHEHGSHADHGSPSGDHHVCTCLGSCHAPMSAVLPASGQSSISIDAVAIFTGFTPVSHLFQNPEYTLPYAVGPPPLA
ncbi:MAG TPA: hypothetical protein VFU03_05195 [Gemmatimonadales bacterium]|nr:hypothetical protein [Gemmatimonadales bacterium]